MELFVNDNNIFRTAKIGAYRVMAFVSANIYMFMRFITLIVLVFGAWLSFNGQLTHGELVAFVLFTNVLFKPIDKISALLELYPKGMAGFKRFTDLLDIEPEVKDRKDAKAATAVKGDNSFENVTFGYKKTQAYVVKLMDMYTNVEEKVAFVVL